MISSKSNEKSVHKKCKSASCKVILTSGNQASTRKEYLRAHASLVSAQEEERRVQSPIVKTLVVLYGDGGVAAVAEWRRRRRFAALCCLRPLSSCSCRILRQDKWSMFFGLVVCVHA